MTTINRAQVLARLALELGSLGDARPTAKVAIARAIELMPGTDWVSLTVRSSRVSFLTLAASHDVAEQADELQYVLREGPCVQASTRGEWYLSSDVASDARWPRWGPQAAALGIGSLLSIQLASNDEPLGALNMYSSRAGAYSDRDEVDFALLYGAHVAMSLTSAQELTGLHSAILTRHTIGVCQGMLMERYDLDRDASFTLLTRYAAELGRPLAEVAADIVAGHRLTVTAREPAAAASDRP